MVITIAVSAVVAASCDGDAADRPEASDAGFGVGDVPGVADAETDGR